MPLSSIGHPVAGWKKSSTDVDEEDGRKRTLAIAFVAAVISIIAIVIGKKRTK